MGEASPSAASHRSAARSSRCAPPLRARRDACARESCCCHATLTVYDCALLHQPEPPEEETSRPASGRRKSTMAAESEPEPVPSRRASSRTRMPTLRHQAPKWWMPPEDVIDAADAYDRRNHTRSLVAEGMLEHLALDYEHQRGAQSFHDALQARHRSTAP